MFNVRHRKLILFIIISLLIITNAESEHFAWARGILGTSESVSFGWKIVVDNKGNSYIVGRFIGTVDFDPGPSTFNLTHTNEHDIFVLKLNSNGDFIWAISFSGTGDLIFGETENITLDNAGNIYIVGSFSGTIDFDPGPSTYNLISTPTGKGDAFVLKLSAANGGFVWVKKIGGYYSRVYITEAVVDRFGDIYLTGSFGGTVDFDPGEENFELTTKDGGATFVSKLDSAGNFCWAKGLFGTGSCGGLGIALDATTGIYVTGSFTDTYDFDPSHEVFELTSAGEADIFILNLDLNGNFVWVKRMGGSGYDSGRHVVLDNQSIYITGTFEGTDDFEPHTIVSENRSDNFLLRLSKNGDFIWGKTGERSGIGIDFDADNVGYVYTAMADVVSKFDVSGNLVWIKEIEGGSKSVFFGYKNIIQGITVDNNGYVYATGNFLGTVDFDPGPETVEIASAEQSTFVLKLGPDESPPMPSEPTCCIGANKKVSVTELLKNALADWLLVGITVLTLLIFNNRSEKHP